MPRFLALDWGPSRIRLVSAVAGRGTVRIEQALAWDEGEALTPATAEALGQRLRERLKAAHVGAAPVLGSLGRDQVIIKEIRYPRVAAAEEPALVRFQAAKELTEATEGLVIDYTPLDRPAAGGEQRALILVARRDLVNAWKAMCRAAGLKLAALTPRPFGLAACLPGAAAPTQGEDASALLAVAADWAEFSVARGQTLLYARPLPLAGAMQPEEIRRNLALYAGQATAAPVRALFVAEDGDALRSRLEELLAIPVPALDPFAGVEAPTPAPSDRAGFGGAVGLVRLWAARGTTPVNFAAPKEPRPVTHTGRRRALRLAGLAVLGLVVLLILGNMVLASRRSEVQRLEADRDDAEAQLARLQPDKKRYQDLADWHKTALPVLDELYDLTARFPFKDEVKLTRLEINPLTAKTAKEAATRNKEYTTRMVLTGLVPANEDDLVERLVDTINRDPHCRAEIDQRRPVTGAAAGGDKDGGKGGGPVPGNGPGKGPDKRGGKGPGKALEEFVLHVDIAPQPAASYTTRLTGLPPAEKGGFGRRPGFGQWQGFGGKGGRRMGP